jgi:hypothetical protein
LGLTRFCALWEEAPIAPLTITEIPMTTSAQRVFVSIAATITTLALGACIRAPSRSESDPLASTYAGLLTIRFENSARERVDVYLIGEKREWVLGRVEPGAITSLRIPEEALAKGSTFVRLAVLAGEPLTFAVARNPRARLTIAQPASVILSQRWNFSQGELTSLRR